MLQVKPRPVPGPANPGPRRLKGQPVGLPPWPVDDRLSKLGSGFQVGPAHAGKIADVTAEADTFRIFAEPGINVTAPGRWRPFTSAAGVRWS